MAKDQGKKKGHEVPAEPTAQERSEFAYQPTKADLAQINLAKPFGSISYKYMKGLLMQRVSTSRYVHSLSVAKTARKIARAYGYDAHQARMAGLLHDWDKALSPARLADRVRDYHLPIDEDMVASMPWVLHGPTAAAVLAEEFPFFGDEVFQAIERHTTAAPDMAPLDMIVFVADKIEPTHDVEVYKRLYKQIGDLPLEDLFFAVLKEGMAYLVRADKPISPDSVAVWNWYSEARKAAKDKESK